MIFPRPCCIELKGTVVHGKGLGRTVGMPTANIQLADGTEIPESGVYASLILVDGKTYKGMTNIGTRPTVDSNETITVETYIIDFNEDIYGKQITLILRAYIREIIKFESLEKVKRHVLEQDIPLVKQYLEY